MPVETNPSAAEELVDRKLHPLRRRIDCSGPASWASAPPAPTSADAATEAFRSATSAA